MRNIIILILSILSISANAAATNSSRMSVTSIESRASGVHDIYFSNTVPDQGCNLTDRANLDERLVAGKSMFSVLLSSFMANKEVVIRVDGCLAAPTIIKVQVYQQKKGSDSN